MVRKEIAYGLRIFHEQTGTVYDSIKDCSEHVSVDPTQIRAILEGRKRDYKGLSF